MKKSLNTAKKKQNSSVKRHVFDPEPDQLTITLKSSEIETCSIFFLFQVLFNII